MIEVIDDTVKSGKEKVCTKCKQTKPVEEFPLNRRMNDGYDSWCYLCRSENARQIIKTREWKDSKNKAVREDRKINPLRYRIADWVKQGINITEDEYLELYNQQEGKCVICGREEGDLDRRLEVDHCHNEGKVRGLLCRGCNHVLGACRDDVTILERAIKYLKDGGKT